MLIAPDDLESLLETLDVLSDAETMAAIKEARDPNARMYTLEEVEAAMKERRQRPERHDVSSAIAPAGATRPRRPGSREAVAAAALEFIHGPLLENPHRVGKPLQRDLRACG